MMGRVLILLNDLTNKECTEDTKIVDLGLDSLEFLELMVELDIPSEAIDELHTVGDIANYISNKVTS
jgi:acyl carrier protein